MKKYFITGVSGFVAQHFIELLEQSEPSSRILGLDLMPPKFRYNHEFASINLLDYEKLENVLMHYDPDFIVHLASFSSVAKSWENPSSSFLNNTNIFLNILECVRKNCVGSRILSVGSSEEYGKVEKSSIPLKESEKLNPISPYAVARVAQEQLSSVYAQAFGLDIVITRSFNHIGKGQRSDFVVPSIARQFALQVKNSTFELKVGDVSIVRDFLDVRDVARAYWLLLNKGVSGTIYNVCSGIGHSIEDIIKKLSRIASLKYKLVVDSSKIRPNDNMLIVGDNMKICSEIGWFPEISIDTSLEEIYKEQTESII